MNLFNKLVLGQNYGAKCLLFLHCGSMVSHLMDGNYMKFSLHVVLLLAHVCVVLFCVTRHSRLEFNYSFVEKNVKVHCSPILIMTNIYTIYKHDPKVKAVRLNAQITEVKQS